MAISEKIELLGKGLYKDIPDVLTLKSMPTASELDYIGSEDFDVTMLDKILPESVEEKINFRDLLEIDYQWICRCLRILNYGPYHTTGTIFCDDCGVTSRGEYRVNLNTVACKPLPKGFTNRIVISHDQFISFNHDIELHLPTIQEMMNASNDKAFQNAVGRTNRELSRICYMVSAIGTQNALTPIEIRYRIQNELEPADYMILKKEVTNLTDYGLRAGGTVQCPNCHSNKAAFLALIDDRFFRPTLDDLRAWKADRMERKNDDSTGNKTAGVRRNNR